MSANETPYTVHDARYAQGRKLVRVAPSADGFQSRAGRLLVALKCRYTNRERGYICSPTKLARFEKLWKEGRDANYFGELDDPRGES